MAGHSPSFPRRGALEVELDVLLGVTDVLLAPSARAADAVVSQRHETAVPSARAPVAPSGTPAPNGRRFEADLFAPTARPPRDAGRSAANARTEAATVEAPVPAVPDAPRNPAGPASGTTATATVLADTIAAPDAPSKAERLARLAELHAAQCPHCTAATGWRNIVFGEGDPEAEFFFVGEAPGEMEDETGRPFIGPAGEKLGGMIAAMGLDRSKVYIANVLKTRPPGNRTPLVSEIERCGPYLLAQLAVVRPKVIVTLGGPATKLLLASELGITRLRGVPARVTLGAAEGAPFEVPVLPTFHPAYLLRNYTVETRGQMWSDLQAALRLAGRTPPERASATRGAERSGEA